MRAKIRNRQSTKPQRGQCSVTISRWQRTLRRPAVPMWRLVAKVATVLFPLSGRCPVAAFLPPSPQVPIAGGSKVWQSSSDEATAHADDSPLRCPMSDPTFNTDDNDSDEIEKQLPPPSFLSALLGIALAGSPWDYMLDLRAKGYDGVVPINLGPVGVYNFLLSPESVRAATVEQAATLPRRFSVPLFETLELDRGLVYEQGERHKRHKRICIPSFEQSISMASFVEATRDELDAVGDRFDDVASSGRMLDLYSEMRRATLNVVLAVTFGLGKKGASSFDRADELSQIIGEYLERIVALANEVPPLWQISPRLSSNYIRVTDFLLPTLRELVAEVISARRQLEAKEVIDRADLLSVLVQQDLTDADIRSILFDVVIAGSDTTASTATAALYVLHDPKNAKWLEKAREEAIAKNAGDGVALADIKTELPVSTAVAREILRLYPPVPFVGRTATDDGALCNGLYPVKEGDTFCFSPWFLGRDPKAWGGDLQSEKDRAEAANQFNPQRWLADGMNGGAPSSFSWLPFGAGPRGCLGTRLGLTEVTLGVSRLLRDYEFEFEQSGPLPVKYDLTLNLDGVMNCRIAKRTSNR